ncbi:hypothetical protein PFISCL1PPCAC_11436, partial [Pristionchus fissidentatus]
MAAKFGETVRRWSRDKSRELDGNLLSWSALDLASDRVAVERSDGLLGSAGSGGHWLVSEDGRLEGRSHLLGSGRLSDTAKETLLSVHLLLSIVVVGLCSRCSSC